MIDLGADELAEVERICALMVPSSEVWAFGSRCKGTARKHSDLDLLVKGPRRLDVLKLEEVREAFQESLLPFRVDVADWHALSDDFRRMLEKDLHPVLRRPPM